MQSSRSKRCLCCLWCSIFIFAAAPPVVAKLILLGGSIAEGGRNPISFCNVLAVGNIVAGLTLYLIFRKDWAWQKLQGITPKQWGIQLVIAISSGALAPALMFMAIERTSVNNIVLIETLEVPLVLLFAWLIYGLRSDLISIVGAVLALVGVVVTLQLQSPPVDSPALEGMMKGKKMMPRAGGEIYAVISVIIFVLGSVVSKKLLENVPLGVFSVFRNLVGSVVFIIVVMMLLGPSHFAELFHPKLWLWMLLYGGVIIVLGQICWFKGIAQCSPNQIAMATAFSPVAGVSFAFLILGDVPTVAQWVGGAIIMAGISVGSFGATVLHRAARSWDKFKGFGGV